MSAAEGEVISPMLAETTPAEPAAAEVVATETQPQKPAKEKKVRVPKEKKKKPKEAPSHPPYFEMIKEAISALQEKNGSSAYAIAKYMEEKHKAELPANYKKMLALQLKNCIAKGKLTKVKASFKLAESGKEKAAKGKETKKPKQQAAAAAPPKTRSAKKIANKMGGRRAKKSVAVKPKQLKSIKSPAAKKTKKASV